jgi:hypothetical protein
MLIWAPSWIGRESIQSACSIIQEEEDQSEDHNWTNKKITLVAATLSPSHLQEQDSSSNFNIQEIKTIFCH